MVQNYNILIDAMTQFSDNHLALKRFKVSFFEQFDNFSTEGNEFPILYAIPNDVTLSNNIDEFSFRVYCIDILQKDRSNETSILNQTLSILRDLTNWFRSDLDIPMNILNTPLAVPVNNFMTEFTTGWYIDITIEATPETSDCSIPFEDGFFYTGSTCSGGGSLIPTGPATVQNSDLTYDVRVEPEAVLILPDSTITNSSGSYSIELPATSDLVLDDIEIDVTDLIGTILATYSNAVYDEIIIEVPVPPLVVNEWLEIVIDTRISSVSASDEFYLRLRAGSIVEIDWENNGDIVYLDNIIGNFDPQVIHKYPSEGIYTIRIKGVGFLQMQNADGPKIIEFKNCGLFRHTDTSSMFFSTPNMVVTATDRMIINTNQINQIFYSASLMVTPPVIDTIARTQMFGTFQNTALNANLGYYNLRNCINMTSFAEGVSTWNESNYGNTLLGWLRWDSNTHAPAVGWVLKSNVSFHGGSSTLTTGSEAALARQYLIDILGWIITDGGLV